MRALIVKSGALGSGYGTPSIANTVADAPSTYCHLPLSSRMSEKLCAAVRLAAASRYQRPSHGLPACAPAAISQVAAPTARTLARVNPVPIFIEVSRPDAAH